MFTDSPLIVADTDVQAAAAAARRMGMVAEMHGRSETLAVFADGVTDDVLGRAFLEDATRPAVAHALNAAHAAYTDLCLRSAALSLGGAFPTRDGAVVDVTFLGSEEPADLTWTQLFDVRDFRATREEDFEMVDVTNAVTFRTYADGERIELSGVSGSVAKFPFQLVAGGFQYSWTWEQDSKFWRVADGLRSMSTNYAQNMARLAWAVATNATGLTTTTRDATGASTVEKDVNTVNKAAVEILAAVRASGRALPANPSFILAYNNLTPGYADRAAAMQAANYGLANASLGAAKLAFPVVPVGSPEVPTGAMYLFLPKGKFKTGVRLDLTVFEKFEPTNLSEARVGAGRYTHVRGDGTQVRLIPLS